jgi:hypothetical protein
MTSSSTPRTPLPPPASGRPPTGYGVAPYDEAELDRLRGLGFDGPEDDSTVLVEPARGGPRLWFQLVPEAKRAKNRVHLDLRAADLDAETRRLTALGPSVVARHDGHPVGVTRGAATPPA